MKILKTVFHFCVAYLSYWFYGRPARKMIVIGVTGTKGKSSTCRMIASVLSAGGDKVGMLSTVEIQIGDRIEKNKRKLTMLGRGRIQRLLRDMSREKCRYAVVETSSQGILQYRHLGLHYDWLVFTNLAPEHIEAHGGYEKYKKTKLRIFRNLKKGSDKFIQGKKIDKIILANTDDKEAVDFLDNPADKKITFSIDNPAADWRAVVESTDAQGTVFTIKDHKFNLNIPGDFNVYNALPAVALGREAGLDFKEINAGLAQVSTVAGRMEMVEAGQDFNVVVDFAHETLSYEKLFNALRKMVQPGGKLIAIVGSDGGGRDKSKRPLMGEVAGRLCDMVIVSDVNPFDEDPIDIINQVASGVKQSGKKEGEDLFLIANRREAIARALSGAKAGDVVAIVGKGNETDIIRAHGKREPWSDMEVAREEIKKIQVIQ